MAAKATANSQRPSKTVRNALHAEVLRLGPSFDRSQFGPAEHKVIDAFRRNNETYAATWPEDAQKARMGLQTRVIAQNSVGQQLLLSPRTKQERLPPLKTNFPAAPHGQQHNFRHVGGLPDYGSPVHFGIPTGKAGTYTATAAEADPQSSTSLTDQSYETISDIASPPYHSAPRKGRQVVNHPPGVQVYTDKGVPVYVALKPEDSAQPRTSSNSKRSKPLRKTREQREQESRIVAAHLEAVSSASANQAVLQQRMAGRHQAHQSPTNGHRANDRVQHTRFPPGGKPAAQLNAHLNGSYKISTNGSHHTSSGPETLTLVLQDATASNNKAPAWTVANGGTIPSGPKRGTILERKHSARLSATAARASRTGIISPSARKLKSVSRGMGKLQISPPTQSRGHQPATQEPTSIFPFPATTMTHAGHGAPLAEEARTQQDIKTSESTTSLRVKAASANGSNHLQGTTSLYGSLTPKPSDAVSSSSSSNMLEMAQPSTRPAPQAGGLLTPQANGHSTLSYAPTPTISAWPRGGAYTTNGETTLRPKAHARVPLDLKPWITEDTIERVIINIMENHFGGRMGAGDINERREGPNGISFNIRRSELFGLPNGQVFPTSLVISLALSHFPDHIDNVTETSAMNALMNIADGNFDVAFRTLSRVFMLTADRDELTLLFSHSPADWLVVRAVKATRAVYIFDSSATLSAEAQQAVEGKLCRILWRLCTDAAADASWTASRQSWTPIWQTDLYRQSCGADSAVHALQNYIDLMRRGEVKLYHDTTTLRYRAVLRVKCFLDGSLDFGADDPGADELHQRWRVAAPSLLLD